MFVYYALYVVPPIFGTLAGRLDSPIQKQGVWIAAGLILWLATGFALGAFDWPLYLRKFNQQETLSLYDAMRSVEPGFVLLMRGVQSLGLGLIVVIATGAAVVMVGLLMFSKQSAKPWLALVLAIQPIVIFMGMGFLRQGIALGFAMMAMALMLQARTILPFMLLLIAISFHRSAIIFIPIYIAFLAGGYLRPGWVLALGLGLFFALVAGVMAIPIIRWEVLHHNHAHGAVVRASITLAVFCIFLARQRLWTCETERRLLLATVPIALFSILAAYAFSAFGDRLLYYTVPAQILILTRACDLVPPGGRRVTAAGLGIASFALFALWMTFSAKSADLHQPYRSALIERSAFLKSDTTDYNQHRRNSKSAAK
ncbi:MAG: EpsG family protein [Sphingomonadaceae bacterium]